MNLEASYRYCARISRSKAKNFYYSFLFLPKRKKAGISAIYAFMRVCDDIADESSSDELKQESLSTWKDRVRNFLKGTDLTHPVFPALRDTLDHFNIPAHYLLELIEGVQMDLTPRRFKNFEELYPYCYKVASVVGLVCLYIFGFEDKKALSNAEACGIAFQLTNILRDLKEDAQMGRVYLPREDLEKFGYREEDLVGSKLNENFYRLMEFETQRAEEFYQKAHPLTNLIAPDSRKALRVMIAVYYGILKKIKRCGYNTLTQRINLNLWEKIGIILPHLRTSDG